jgi:PhnB protein
MKVNPYLMFDGNCEEAFKFYEKCLGAKIEAMLPHEGSPAEGHVPPEWNKKILHARMRIGDTVLMASDSPPGRQDKAKGGFSITLHTDTPEEAERIFAALGDKGTSTMPMGPTFFATRFGMLNDKFGMPWMIICEKD